MNLRLVSSEKKKGVEIETGEACLKCRRRGMTKKYAFLDKNKGTFISKTFHFLSESILFFIFDQKRQISFFLGSSFILKVCLIKVPL